MYERIICQFFGCCRVRAGWASRSGRGAADKGDRSEDGQSRYQSPAFRVFHSCCIDAMTRRLKWPQSKLVRLIHTPTRAVPGGATGASAQGPPALAAKHTEPRSAPVLWVRPIGRSRAPNFATERRSLPPWPQRRTARRLCSRTASMPSVGRLGLHREHCWGTVATRPGRFGVPSRAQLQGSGDRTGMTCPSPR